MVKSIHLKVRVLTNFTGDQGSIPGRVISKTQNMVLDTSSTVSIVKHGSKVCEAIQGKELRPSLPFSVVAVEKGTFDYGQPTY